VSELQGVVQEWVAMSRAVGALLAVTAFLACPCHLVITLPLLVGIFGGTAVGAFLAANSGLVVLMAVVYFLVGLGSGWYLLTRERPRPGRRSAPGRPAVDCCLPPADARPERRSGHDLAADEDVALPVGR
jgi:mercuric ion transport protein